MLNSSRESPLHLAAAEGHALCVSELVLGGADVDSRTPDGDSPLQLAVDRGHLGVVNELLAVGAHVDVRKKCYPGDYPLHVAASLGRVEIARALSAAWK